MQRALRAAVDVPMMVAKKANSVWPSLKELAKIFNINCKSDLQVRWQEFLQRFSTVPCETTCLVNTLSCQWFISTGRSEVSRDGSVRGLLQRCHQPEGHQRWETQGEGTCSLKHLSQNLQFQSKWNEKNWWCLQLDQDQFLTVKCDVIWFYFLLSCKRTSRVSWKPHKMDVPRFWR